MRDSCFIEELSQSTIVDKQSTIVNWFLHAKVVSLSRRVEFANIAYSFLVGYLSNVGVAECGRFAPCTRPGSAPWVPSSALPPLPAGSLPRPAFCL